jgi:hypothetical protein
MSAVILTFPTAASAVKPPVAELDVTGDDYSVKVQAAEDDRFWVRVERNFGETITVTDFARGELPETDLIGGLKLAIQALGIADRRRIVFRDIVPGGMDKALFAFRLEQATECAKRAATAIAADSGCLLRDFRIEHRAGKMDAVASFS